MENILNGELKEREKRLERWMPTIYYCSQGYPTIAWGHNLLTKDLPVEAIHRWGEKFIFSRNGITYEQGEFLLEADLKDALHDASLIFSFDTILSWSKKRQIAILDMIFNMGRARFKGFDNLIIAIKSNNWEKAGHEIKYNKNDFTPYYKTVMSRAKENINLIING